MTRDTQKIIKQGREIITSRADMTVKEMTGFLDMVKTGQPFEAIRQAFLLGAGVGYNQGKKK